jgi:hypothetical protein
VLIQSIGRDVEAAFNGGPAIRLGDLVERAIAALDRAGFEIFAKSAEQADSIS